MSREDKTAQGSSRRGRTSPGILTRFLLLLAIVTTTASLVIYTRLNGEISGPAATATHTATPPPPIKSQQIISENLLAGTSDWQIADARIANGEIQGYASSVSIVPGQRLSLYVSVRRDRDPYTISIYRLGWYGGKGGRLLLTVHETGHAQGWYFRDTATLSGCVSCVWDLTTHELEANWTPSYSLTIPATWVTGIYYVKFTESGGKEDFTMFDVRGDSHSTYLATTGDATWAAYNTWGGYSLYRGPDGMFETRARSVSLDRPSSYYEALATLSYEINTMRWMEREGYDVSYVSDIDLDANPSLLLTHHVYISLGHDEYWSRGMRTNVEKARDSGIALLFMGSNAVFWQIRFASDASGGHDRVIIGYKAQSEDPLNGVENSLVTVEWRDPLIGQPENGLVGIMFSGYAHSPGAFPWHLDTTADPSLLAGTGLQPGTQYGCDLVGHEWDRVFDNGDTPLTLHILSTSPTVDVSGSSDYSNSTYYVADSGSLVFATGSLNWGYALDDLRLFANPACAGKTAVIPGMQALMRNVMEQAVLFHEPGQPGLPRPLPTVTGGGLPDNG